MIKIRYEIKSKKIGKLRNDPKHIHNVQIVLIDKKTIWMRKDRKALSRETRNGRNRWKNSAEKMGKGVQNASHACVLSCARYISRLFYESVHPKTRSLFAFYMPPSPSPPTFIPATGHAVNVKSRGTRKIE